MASSTPKKSVSEKISNLCRCCSSDNTSHRVHLYGAKSEQMDLVSAIFRLTGIKILENDNFSKWVCRSCTLKIDSLRKKLSEFKTVCEETARKQEEEFATSRSKRGRKDTQPLHTSPMPSPSALPGPKRTRMAESSASRSLAECFQAIAPNLADSQPLNSLSGSNPQSPTIQINPRQAPRTLPVSFPQTNKQDQTINCPPAAQSEENALFSTCGLQALKGKLIITVCLANTFVTSCIIGIFCARILILYRLRTSGLLYSLLALRNLYK